MFYRGLMSRIVVLVTAICIVGLLLTTIKPLRQPIPERPASAKPQSPAPAPQRTLQASTEQMEGRYESVEVWRADNVVSFENTHLSPARKHRPGQQSSSNYGSKGDYLRQTLIGDYPSKDVEDIFLMMKTGAQTMWDRLPVHFFTTFTRVKNFAIYSDAAGSIAGHEVIDILRHLPNEILEDEQLNPYWIMHDAHRNRNGWHIDEIDLGSDADIARLDKLKHIPMLAHAYKTSPNSKWFIFMDDNSYILWGNMVQLLQGLDPTKPLYMGSSARTSSRKEYHGHAHEFYAQGGPGVVISKAVMDRLFGPTAGRSIDKTVEYYSQMALKQEHGDFLVSIALAEAANVFLEAKNARLPSEMFQSESLRHVVFGPHNWCLPILTFSQLSSSEIETLWEYERLNPVGQTIRYSELYRDFVLPYITDEVEGWEVPNHYYEYTDSSNTDHDENGKAISPSKRAQDCKAACVTDDACYSWTWRQGLCHISGEILLGNAANKYQRDFSSTLQGKTPTAGWMISRIRQIRVDQKCDALGMAGGVHNDTAADSEGWYLRSRPEHKSIDSDADSEEV